MFDLLEQLIAVSWDWRVSCAHKQIYIIEPNQLGSMLSGSAHRSCDPERPRLYLMLATELISKSLPGDTGFKVMKGWVIESR